MIHTTNVLFHRSQEESFLEHRDESALLNEWTCGCLFSSADNVTGQQVFLIVRQLQSWRVFCQSLSPTKNYLQMFKPNEEGHDRIPPSRPPVFDHAGRHCQVFFIVLIKASPRLKDRRHEDSNEKWSIPGLKISTGPILYIKDTTVHGIDEIVDTLGR